MMVIVKYCKIIIWENIESRCAVCGLLMEFSGVEFTSNEQKNSAYSVKVCHSTREFQLRKKVNVKEKVEKAYSSVLFA